MATSSLTGFTGGSFLENAVNAKPQIIDGDVTFTDADNDYNGGTLVVSGLLAEDVISLANGARIHLKAGVVSFDADGPGGAATVTIGKATGGAGSNFVVTFNAKATAAGIEALVESLTYANTSNTPTADRHIAIAITDAAGHGLSGGGDGLSYVERTGADNPFGAINAAALGLYPMPTLADLDHDGDQDLLLGYLFENQYYFHNTGTAGAPVYGSPDGPLALATGLQPRFVDLDGDGDLDIVGGTISGAVAYYKNTGSRSEAVFVAQLGEDNPFSALNFPNGKLDVADVDGDGDLDLLIGQWRGDVRYFENTGSQAVPHYELRTGGADPFDAVLLRDIGDPMPTFGDVDGDGDIDLVLGSFAYGIRYFDNTGTATSPHYVEQAGAANPWNGVNIGYMQAPQLIDYDGDSDLDLVVATNNNQIHYFENTATVAVGLDIHVTAEIEVILGTPRADVLNGTADGERIQGLAANDTLNGNGGDDILEGGAGKDTLNGGDGDDDLDGGADPDIMAGGAGDDTYHADARDTLTEGLDAGHDTVIASATFTLGANFEGLELAGTGNINGTGNELDNLIAGNSGNNILKGLGGNDFIEGGDGDDRLDGGAGFDALIGGAGNDTYIVDSRDMVVEDFNAGIDTIITDAGKFVLGENFENLTGTSTDRQYLEGNGLNNVITGGKGADWLEGGGGNDRLIGGAGADALVGGRGADTFVFLTSDKSAKFNPAAIDVILDFNSREGDTIDLSGFDANANKGGMQAFTYVGEFTHHAGEARYSFDKEAGFALLSLDTNGDGNADFQVRLLGRYIDPKIDPKSGAAPDAPHAALAVAHEATTDWYL